VGVVLWSLPVLHLRESVKRLVAAIRSGCDVLAFPSQSEEIPSRARIASSMEQLRNARFTIWQGRRSGFTYGAAITGVYNADEDAEVVAVTCRRTGRSSGAGQGDDLDQLLEIEF
jgi:hypothetical protein